MEDCRKEDGERKIIWESRGYFGLFGMPLYTHHYVLYEDSISVTTGFPTIRTQSVKLHTIGMREIIESPIGRMFRCGKIRLLTTSHKLPNLVLYVKEPAKVLQLIEDAKVEEQRRYSETSKNRNKNSRNTRKTR